MISQDSLQAALPTGAIRKFCSLQAGWRNVLLRAYKDPLDVEHFTTTPTPDQKIVLVTAGSCDIAGWSSGAWRGVTYRPGHIGLVAPGEAARLRWRGTDQHHNIQLHIPGAVIAAVTNDLFGPSRSGLGSLRCLSLIDQVVASTLVALDRAARSGAPDLYADTAAHFLVSHLLLRETRIDARPQPMPGPAALRHLTDYMRAGLARSITFSELAEVAGVSRFQLLRTTKRIWGETPLRRLTQMRMELAQELLLSKQLTVIEVALECGYANSSHFATAFKRVTGRSPSAWCRD